MRHARRTARARWLAAALLLAAALPARAARERLEWKLSVDLPVTLGAALLWGGTEALKPRLAPGTCRVCGSNAFDEGARALLRWSDPAPARHASDALAFAVLPAAVVTQALVAARAGGDRWSEGFADLLVVAEAAALAGAFDQAVKFAVGRRRPFALHGDPARPREPDDDLSFYSGHTSLTFSLAVGAATVARLRGDASAPWVLAGGLTLATATGWLRVAGDKHWLTDVLTGAAAGAAFGWGVPWLLHRSARGGAAGPGGRAAPLPLPLGVSLAF